MPLEEKLESELCDLVVPWLPSLEIKGIGKHMIETTFKRHCARISALLNCGLDLIVVIRALTIGIGK